MTTKEKVTILYDESKVILRVIRDLKVAAKSIKKIRLTKIERHQALLVTLYLDLLAAYEKD